MAFLDTLGTITDNIGKKANNAVEVSKINGKISAEAKNILELKQELGEYCFEQYKAGQLTDADVILKCEAIKIAEENIRSMKAEVKNLKDSSPKSIIPKKVPVVCPNCGVEMKPEMKFCGICGRELKAFEPAPEMEVLEAIPDNKKTCPDCGEIWGSKILFCGKCGKKLD